MLKKNELYKTEIIDIGADGEGICKIDGFTIFIENALPEDYLELKIIKLKKNYGYGKIVKIIKPSPHRVKPLCPVFGKCGGCNLQHCSYEKQLELKSNKVYNNLKRIGGFEDIKISSVIGMENPFFYRNKAQFPVSEIEGLASIGFYSKRSHNLVPVKKCYIQNKESETILAIIENFLRDQNIKAYDETTHKGVVRHILIRKGFNTNEIMVCIIINAEDLEKKEKLIEKLRNIKEITSIYININKLRTNVILGTEIKVLWGKPYITEELLNLKFKISPLSFFQVNPIQTEILYKKVIDFANISANDVVIDAYCGIGTISLFLAQKAKKVIGVEIIKEAVLDAKENAKINNIDNVDFICAKAEEIIPELTAKEKINVILVDPPRKGCEKALLETFIMAKPERIVYISCDSATLARDLKILCEFNEYKIINFVSVDCFPMTTHIESVVLLEKYDN